MYSQGYANGPVPVLPSTNNSASHFSNGFPRPGLPGFVNNYSFPPSFGPNTGVNSTSPINCNINALISVPPPGFSSNNANSLPSQRPQGSIVPSRFANPPPFGAPPFPGSPSPFPNSTAVQQYAAYSNFQAPNFAYPPPGASFTVPPPPIPRLPPRNVNNSQFSAANSRQHAKYSKQTKQNMPFHCESCDRDFPTEAKQKQHISEHVICGIEGCNFSAHMKIVEKHISLQHRTGLFNRIVKGNSPEEIAKWVADRKRQFPTREKIEEKQAQKEEMSKRGESYCEPRKKFNNRFSNDNRKPNRSNKFDNSHRFPLNKRIRRSNSLETIPVDQSPDNPESRPRKRREVLVKDVEDDDDRYIRNLLPFRGTEYYVEADDEEESDSVGKNDIVSNETIGATSPVDTSASSLIHSDVDNCELSSRSPSLVQSTMSTSLDLLKAYDFSDDEEDPDEIVEKTETSPEITAPNITETSPEITALDITETSPEMTALDITETSPKITAPDVTETSSEIIAPDITQLSDDSEPEECCSKICPVIPDEIIISNEPVSSAEEPDSKKSRKRKRHKDNENSEESKNEKKVKEADKERPNVPDLMNHQKRNRRPTLLEKLLASEIRHERNVILQCVRYVVQNDYFDTDQSK